MIVLQFILANAAKDAASETLETAILGNHKSVGISIFVLTLLRLGWRLRHGVPRPLPMPQWQLSASQVSHWSMYALILLLPVTGWLTSSASGSGTSWFDLVDLPDLVPPDPGREATLEEIHEMHAKLLLVIAVLHISAAAWHTIKRQQALVRITSTGPVLTFIAIALLGTLTLTGTRDSTLSTMQSSASNTGLQPWRIDYPLSSIRFIASQAGSPMQGEWQEWHGDIRFDGARLDDCRVDVSITVASVETFDDERDSVLLQREWFHAENFPEVRYRAARFERLADRRYAALGTLSVKGRTAPVTLEFTLETDGARYLLDGTARLDRLRLDLGLGEFSDTRWIGQQVTVTVHIEATASN